MPAAGFWFRNEQFARMPGIVRPTLEVTITETAADLRRQKRDDLGIALIKV
jgi:predicted DNA-binding protein with PD1-like motif